MNLEANNWQELHGSLDFSGIDALEIQEGYSDEEIDWHKRRWGKFTSSTLGDLFSSPTTKTYQKAVYKVVWQRLVAEQSFLDGFERTNVVSKPMVYGSENESLAIAKYEEVTGQSVRRSLYGFVDHSEFFGGTPDGYVNENKIIEVKCPYNGGNHIFSLIEKNVYDKKHFYQIQGNMMVTGAGECDYITFDPSLPEGLNISITTIKRDEKIIEDIKKALDSAKEIVLRTMDKINNAKAH